MIAELFLGAGLVGAGWWTLRRLQRSQKTSGPGDEDARPALSVGDVLLAGDYEYWLAGEVSLHDGRQVLRLFPAPAADPSRGRGVGSQPYVAHYLVCIGEGTDDTAMLQPLEGFPEGAVPQAWRVGATDYRLVRSGTAKAVRRGQRVAVGGESVRYHLLRNATGEALLVLDGEDGVRLALQGPRFDLDACERLPGVE